MRALTAFCGLLLAAAAAAQTPQPFPQPRGSQPPPPPAEAAPARPDPAAPAAPAPPSRAAAATAPAGPDLGGIPLYPSAVWLASYEAGRGQKFHIYGVPLTYADAVTYYQTTLKQRGERLFESPPTHQFEVARFRDAEMAFPPSVTIKDFTWGGSPGYVHAAPGAEPVRFPTLIQIVPLPAAR